MVKKSLAFVIIWIGFVLFASAQNYSLTKEDISVFQKELFEELKTAEETLDTRFGYRTRVVGFNGPTAVVGDLHGDLEVFTAIKNRLSSDLDSNKIKKVVFLGDIMDRGENSAKTLLELLKFFNKYKGKIYILRGNHETMGLFDVEGDSPYLAINDPYFKGIDSDTFKKFFDKLPFAAVINGHTLAVHGGIPHRKFWNDFYGREKIPEDSPDFDVIHSTIWSDYAPKGDAKTMNRGRARFEDDYRMVYYNEACVREFFEHCEKFSVGKDYHEIIHGLKYLIRGHQPYLGSFFQSPQKTVTTVFSALENQGEWLMRQGAKVALVPVEDAPPEEYFAVREEFDPEIERSVAVPLISKSPFIGLRRV
ncbi:MAG: metallophosphoesterase family protein [Clostridia bacterium]|nr:metallophosphoesterase family protein [Clostridia bacterium]